MEINQNSKVLHEVSHFNVIYNCDEIGKKLQSNKREIVHFLEIQRNI